MMTSNDGRLGSTRDTSPRFDVADSSSASSALRVGRRFLSPALERRIPEVFRRRQPLAIPRRSTFAAPLAVVLLAVLLLALSTACATIAPKARVVEAKPDLGTSAQLLAACRGEDVSFCRGFAIALLDHEVASGRSCATDPNLDAVIAVAVVALEAAAPEDQEAHRIVADAFDRVYPCKGVRTVGFVAEVRR